MTHRIREAMRSGDLAPFGQGGGSVEIDETFIGVEKQKVAGAHGYNHKNKVLSLVDRTTGQARSMVIDRVSRNAKLPTCGNGNFPTHH
jgi:hypothetical protein